MLRTRRLWRPAGMGLVLVVAGVVVAAWPVATAGQWEQAAPSALLVLLAGPGADPLDDPVWVELRRRAVRGDLARWQRRELADKLAAALDDAMPDRRRTAGLCRVVLELRAGTPRLGASLAELLEQRSELPAFPSPEDPIGLMRPYQILLASRKAAIRAVIVAGAAEALPVLRRMAENAEDPDLGLVVFALLALGNESDVRLGAAAVERCMQGRYHRSVVIPDEGLLGLALYGGEHGQEVIRRLAESDRGGLGLVPAALVREGPGPPLAAVLAESMADGAGLARTAEQLVYLKHVDEHAAALPVLRRLAGGAASPEVRAWAVRALGMIGADDRKSAALLKELAEGPDEAARAAAAAALRNMGR